ncbi:hypothetical protein ACJJTC_004990 [Scirpophaga incertulas]
MIYDAWNKLTSATIFNCYRHAGFVQDSLSVVSASDDDDDLPRLSGRERWIKDFPWEMKNLNNISAIDDDLATCEEPTDENILQSVIHNGQDSDDNDDDGLEENCTTPTLSEALKAAEVLNVFVHSNFEDDNMKKMMSYFLH